MRVELTQAQKQKYKEEGMVVLDDLFSEGLHAMISHLDCEINQFQIDQNVKKLLTNRSLGEVLHGLTATRPIRLVYSEMMKQGALDFRQFPFQGLLIAIVISESQNQTTFFATNTDYIVNEPSLVALYGTNDTLLVRGKHTHDLYKLYTRRGYESGDRLTSLDSPFVYR